MQSIPAIYDHFYQPIWLPNQTLFITSNNMHYTSLNLSQLFKDHDILSPNQFKIMEKARKVYLELNEDGFLTQPDVDLMIIYSSAIETNIGLNYSKSTNKYKFEWISVKGDGCIDADSINNLCSKWEKRNCKCIELKNNTVRHDQIPQIHNIISYVLNWTFNISYKGKLDEFTLELKD